MLVSKNGIDLTYGLRITLCNSVEVKIQIISAVIFALDDKGCKLMNKIYSKAFVDNDGRNNIRRA